MKQHEQIKQEMREALKARDEVRLSVLRGLMTAFTNELVATKRKPTETLSDEEVLAVIAREAKKRRESIEAFTKGGRPELAEKEQVELAILDIYLPEMMGRDEIEKVVREKMNTLGISDPQEKGKLIGAVMADLKGKADGGDVATVVSTLLA